MFLILAASLPPLAMTIAIYYNSEELNASRDYETAKQNIASYRAYRSNAWADMLHNSKRLAQSDYIMRISANLENGKPQRLDLPGGMVYFDFLEIIDRSGKIRASVTRPGLVGEVIPALKDRMPMKLPATFETIEVDHNGRHASDVSLTPITNDLSLYTGIYIDPPELNLLSTFLKAKVRIIYTDNPDAETAIFEGAAYNDIFSYNDTLYALLGGSKEAGFYLTASFQQSGNRSIFTSLMRTAGTVGLAGILIAILFGIFITGQAKKEIGNLIEAAGRISGGDYKTPVMAYEEGEFSRLADAFTEMMFSIRRTQDKLTMSEKIAAWKAIGQKIAHEIKNPLTPIEISVDDLRRSHREKLPNFDQTVESTTAVIKTETARLKKLLNNFVEFARMAPPEFKEIKLRSVLDEVSSLYRTEIEQNKLEIRDNTPDHAVKIDPDKIKQMLINLIKNALEVEGTSRVTVTIDREAGKLYIRVADDGPGFPEKILEEGIRPYVSTKKEGSGLGLVISQRIAYDHNGTLEIANNENGGGLVTAIIPV